MHAHIRHQTALKGMIKTPNKELYWFLGIQPPQPSCRTLSCRLGINHYTAWKRFLTWWPKFFETAHLRGQEKHGHQNSPGGGQQGFFWPIVYMIYLQKTEVKNISQHIEKEALLRCLGVIFGLVIHELVTDMPIQVYNLFLSFAFSFSFNHILPRYAKTVKSGDFVPGRIWVEFLILVLMTKKGLKWRALFI